MKNIKKSLLFRIIMISFMVSISILAVGCGNKDTVSNGLSTQTEMKASPLTKQELQQLYSDVKKFKGKTVDFYARIFMNPSKDDKGTYVQVYANNEDDKNTLIAIKDSNLDVKNGDIIHVIGVVEKEFEGQNAFGATIKIPIIIASKIEKSDYATAFSKAIKTIEVNKEQNQSGYIIKLKKVEISEKETRVYLSVINNMSKDKISFYTSGTTLIQGSNQLEKEMNFEANYPEINGELLPGVTGNGIISYVPIDLNGENLKIVIDASCDNYDVKINPFTFEVPIK